MSNAPLQSLAEQRRSSLEMMKDAKHCRDEAGRPDAKSDRCLAAALVGDWSWSHFLAGRTPAPQVADSGVPEPKPTATTDTPSHRSDPATDKQINYIRVLMSKLEKLTDTTLPEFTDEQAGKMSKKAASAFIDQMAANVERLERARPAGLTLPAETQRSAAAHPPQVEVPAGRYAVRGSDRTVDFYQVDHGKPGTRWAGYVFASLLTGAPGDWAQQRLSKPATATLLERIRAAGIEDAARLFGEKTETCGSCLSPLSDPQSRVAGYGETCAGKHGYWYPTRAEALEILGESK